MWYSVTAAETELTHKLYSPYFSQEITQLDSAIDKRQRSKREK
jgi:hypothetical protein